MRYIITLPPRVERDLMQITEDLQISKSEAFQRALLLLKHAVEADKVVFKNDDKEQVVLVK